MGYYKNFEASKSSEERARLLQQLFSEIELFRLNGEALTLVKEIASIVNQNKSTKSTFYTRAHTRAFPVDFQINELSQTSEAKILMAQSATDIERHIFDFGTIVWTNCASQEFADFEKFYALLNKCNIRIEHDHNIDFDN